MIDTLLDKYDCETVPQLIKKIPTIYRNHQFNREVEELMNSQTVKELKETGIAESDLRKQAEHLIISTKEALDNEEPQEEVMDIIRDQWVAITMLFIIVFFLVSKLS